MDAAFLDGLAAAFLAVYEDDAEFHVAALALDGVDGFQGGAAGGDDVIDDDDILAGGEVALDLFADAVAFRFLTDGENLERLVRVLAGGGHADGERDRVGSEGHAADRLDGEFFRMDLGTDGVPAEIADEGCAERIEGGDAAIDIKVGLFAGGEGEGSGAYGFFEEEGFEVGGGLEHGGRLDGKFKIQNSKFKEEKSSFPASRVYFSHPPLATVIGSPRIRVENA